MLKANDYGGSNPLDCIIKTLFFPNVEAQVVPGFKVGSSPIESVKWFWNVGLEAAII